MLIRRDSPMLSELLKKDLAPPAEFVPGDRNVPLALRSGT